jgi:prepilin-type processing-associated H-X9-DG protein
MSSLNDLKLAVTRAYSGSPGTLGQLAISYNAYWVPRIGSSGLYPVPLASTNPDLTPWPTKLTDRTVNERPVLTDRVPSNTTSNPALLGNTGHPYGNKIKNVNLLFADGHVDRRKAAEVQLRYLDPLYQWRNFY